jgi:hypothetical protein
LYCILAAQRASHYTFDNPINGNQGQRRASVAEVLKERKQQVAALLSLHQSNKTGQICALFCPADSSLGYPSDQNPRSMSTSHQYHQFSALHVLITTRSMPHDFARKPIFLPFAIY